MTTLGNQLANDTVRMKQVERQIADPLAVEGSVEYHQTCTVSILRAPSQPKGQTGYPTDNAYACRTGSIAWWL